MEAPSPSEVGNTMAQSCDVRAAILLDYTVCPWTISGGRQVFKP